MRFRYVPFALVLCVLPPAAQSRKLNLPLPERPASGVAAAFDVTPDSRRVLYVAEQPGDSRQELRSIAADGSGAAELLSSGIPPEETLEREFFLSPDGARVVFATGAPLALDPDTTGSRTRLYVVGVDGSPRAKRLGEFDGSPGEVRFSPDGQWILYRTLDHEDGRAALWSLPTDGHRDPILLVELQGDLREPRATSGGRVLFLEARAGVEELISLTLTGTERVRLNAPLVTGGDVQQFELSADGARAVYRADQRTNDTFELFSVPVDGRAAPVLLNAALVAGGSVGAFDLSPDARRVAYLATQDSARITELYSVPIDGSAAPVKLNASLQSPQEVEPGARFTPDSNRVVFRADARARDVFELFSVPADGSAPPVRISGPTPAGGDVSAAWDVRKPRIQVTGERVVYLGDLVQGGVDELFSAPLDGSAPRTLLSGSLVTGGNVRGDFVVSADGRTVVFWADRLTDQALELWSVPVSGGEPKKLSLTSLRPDQGIAFALAGDGGHAYFVGSRDGATTELLRVPTLGPGAAAPLVGPLGGGTRGHVRSFAELSTGGRLAYDADQDSLGQPRLVSLRVDGAPEHIRLTDPVVGPYSLAFRANAADRVVFELVSASRNGFFSVPIDRSFEPIELTASLVEPFLYSLVELANGGRDLLFAAGEARSPLGELYCVPVDGSAAPHKLSGTLVPGGRVVDGSFSTTPDGASAVYLAEAETVGVVELYRAPIDGHSAPVKLSGNLVSGGDVRSVYANVGPRVSADGRHVVYTADARSDERVELFVAPVDGSAAPRRLSAELVAGGDVQAVFELTPDARRVLYRADARVDERFELFSVPIDGSAAPARVGPELAPAGDVIRFQLAPDGTTVLVLADVEGAGVLELFASPVFPGRGTVRLALPAGSSAFSSPIAVAAGRVLCQVDLAGDGGSALLALPLDGGPGMRLDWAMQRGAGVQSFQVSADGTTVVYLSDAELDGVDELFAVPIDGSRRAARKNEPLRPGQQVSRFQISADSSRVFYLANQESHSASELFQAFLKPPHAPRRF